MDPPPVPVSQPRALETLIELLRSACEYLPFCHFLLRFLDACGAARHQPRTAPDDVPPLPQQQLQDEDQEEERVDAADDKKPTKLEKKRAKNAIRRRADPDSLKQAAKADIAAVTAASTSTPNVDHDALSRAAKEGAKKEVGKMAANKKADLDALEQAAKARIAASNDAHDALDYAAKEAAKMKAGLDALEQAAKANVAAVTAASTSDLDALNRAAKEAGNIAAKKGPKANAMKAVAAAAQRAATDFAKKAATAAAKRATLDCARAAKDADHSNGCAKENEPAPSPSPSPSSASPTSAGPSSSSRQPELDNEEKERIAHKNYKEESRKLKSKNVTPCMICYFTKAEGNVPKIDNDEKKIRRHVDEMHKGGVIRCKKDGCFTFGKDRREIGMHEYFGHQMR